MISRRILAALLLVSPLALAQPYRWTDDKGVVHFGDAPPVSAKRPVTKAPVRESAPSEPQEPFELQRAQKDFPITLFTAPICKQPCELARAALNNRGIPFSEIQVWNTETFEQLKARAGSENVPALLVGRSAISGFDQSRYDALLDSANYPKAGTLKTRSQGAPAAPEGYEPPPTAEPVPPEAAPAKQGPYDASGLKSNRSDKPGPYDASGLKSNRSDKPGQYVVPGGTN